QPPRKPPAMGIAGRTRAWAAAPAWTRGAPQRRDFFDTVRRKESSKHAKNADSMLFDAKSLFSSRSVSFIGQEHPIAGRLNHQWEHHGHESAFGRHLEANRGDPRRQARPVEEAEQRSALGLRRHPHTSPDRK